MQFHHYLIPAADLLHVWDVLLFPDYSVLLYLQMDPVNLPYTHFLHEYEIQKILKKLGFFNELPNGKFGSATEQAVRKYCKANNLYSKFCRKIGGFRRKAL